MALRNKPAGGLTPARGEGTSPPSGSRCRSGAHPRTRGRDWERNASACSLAGSPPHAGKGPVLLWSPLTNAGLTPARGEGTTRQRVRRGRPWAHPRTRGRDTHIGEPRQQTEGSPPHAGKGPGVSIATVSREGLTPARGEGTRHPQRERTRHRAHPRTRGRDLDEWPEIDQAAGSPPHAGKGRR